jgi:hypothetical protein
VPVAVSTAGVFAGKTVRSISAGYYHTCAIASDNQAYCWGTGSFGRNGNNSTSDAHVPVAVSTSGVLSGKTILSISAGHWHTCAIASDNQAYCWGRNNLGQLGNNSTSDSLVPVAVTASGVLSGKTILSTVSGDAFSCALASDNQAYCWGQNNYSQLGDGSFTQSLVPVRGYTTQYTPLQGSVAATANVYTLQYAVKSAATCSAQTTGFADVTTSTPIAFNTNSLAANGASISTTANDPLGSSQTTALAYISAPGTFTNASSIAAGTMGMWDFSLKDNGAPYNTSYCLRVAFSDGTPLTDSQALPEVRTTTGTLSIGFVNALNIPLVNPTMGFDVIVANTSWQQSNIGFSTPSQKLRIYNDLAMDGWNVSIAPTDGPTALWNRTDNLAKYDFNDVGGDEVTGPQDGADSDLLAGLLAVFPESSTITSSCSTSGLTRGITSVFVEGVTNSITLLSASNTAAMGCNYDLTNIGLSQAVPAAQAAGTYTLDMTVTVVAL